MKEVEVLIKINDKSKSVLEKLQHLKFIGIKEILDIYYHNLLTKKCSPDEKNELKECLRIRNRDGKFYLTYKFDHFDEDSKWIYSDEYETEIKNFEIAQKIIKNLGFTELCRIKSKKHTFSTNDYEITLEEVENLGMFLEVEMLNVKDDEDVLKIKDKIKKFINNLEIYSFEEMTRG